MESFFFFTYRNWSLLNSCSKGGVLKRDKKEESGNRKRTHKLQLSIANCSSNVSKVPSLERVARV